MTPLPDGPEVVATFTLELAASRIVADVVRVHDGTTRLRLSRGEGVGDVLTFAHIAALRRLCLEEMAAAERRAA